MSETYLYRQMYGNTIVDTHNAYNDGQYTVLRDGFLEVRLRVDVGIYKNVIIPIFLIKNGMARYGTTLIQADEFNDQIVELAREPVHAGDCLTFPQIEGIKFTSVSIQLIPIQEPIPFTIVDTAKYNTKTKFTVSSPGTYDINGTKITLNEGSMSIDTDYLIDLDGTITIPNIKKNN